MPAPSWFKRHVALPAEHGAWVFLLSPLLVGLFAGGRWTTPSLYLVVAALAGFLVRQPITLIVKALAGRRSRDVVPAAAFWVGVYGAVGLLHVAALVIRGFGYVLWLAVPAIPVLVWHLALIARRAERRQQLIEIVGAGTLALAAPAAYWIGRGGAEPAGWWLWFLTWAQSAASIVHAYLRLRQRELREDPPPATRLRMAARALVFTTANVVVAGALGVAGAIAPALTLAFGIQWAETVYGTFRTAVGRKPKAIGYRQLAVSVLFTVVFILAWRS